MEKLNKALSDLKAADGRVSQTRVTKAAEYAMRLAGEKKYRDVAFALSQALQNARKEHKLAFLYAIDATLSMEKKATKESSKGSVALALESSIVNAVAQVSEVPPGEKAQVQKVLQKWATRGYFNPDVMRSCARAANCLVDLPLESFPASGAPLLPGGSGIKSNVRETAAKIILDVGGSRPGPPAVVAAAVHLPPVSSSSSLSSSMTDHHHRPPPLPHSAPPIAHGWGSSHHRSQPAAAPPPTSHVQPRHSYPPPPPPSVAASAAPAQPVQKSWTSARTGSAAPTHARGVPHNFQEDFKRPRMGN